MQACVCVLCAYVSVRCQQCAVGGGARRSGFCLDQDMPLLRLGRGGVAFTFGSMLWMRRSCQEQLPGGSVKAVSGAGRGIEGWKGGHAKHLRKAGKAGESVLSLCTWPGLGQAGR